MSKKNIDFTSIMLIHNHGPYNKPQQDIVFSVSLNEHPLKVAQFFKDVAKFMKSKKVLDTAFSEKEHFQFALANEEYPIFPVKWFTFVLDNGDVINHDIAFSTTLIKKNNIRIPFGGFNLSQWESFAKYREYNMKRNAYKFISNQILKAYFKK